MSHIPDWWQWLIVAMACYRLWRLLAADTILDRPRDWITGVDAKAPRRAQDALAVWLRCPWCAGFWISLVLWTAWWFWPQATVQVCVPLSLSLFVGLVQRNYDP